MEILCFGASKEITGTDKINIQINNESMTVGDLKIELQNRYPELANLKSYMIALNQEYSISQEIDSFIS